MKAPLYTAVNLGIKAVTTATVNCDAVDVRDFDEFVHVTFSAHNVAKSSTRKLNAKIQHSDASGSGFSNFPGGAFAEVGNVDNSFQHKAIRVSELKRYIRVVYTRAVSGSSFVASCTLVGWKDQHPAAT